MPIDPQVLFDLAKASAQQMDLSAAIRKVVETTDPTDLLAFETALEEAKEALEKLHPPEDAVPAALKLLFAEAQRALQGTGIPNGELDRLAEAIADYRNPGSSADSSPIEVSELFSSVEDSVEYLMEPILIRKGLTELHGEPKSGKSCFSLYLAISAAIGRQVPGEFITVPAPRRVLYIAFEDGPRRLKRRTMDYLQGLGSSAYPKNLILWDKPDLDLGNPSGARRLRKEIGKFKVDIVIIDTLSHVHRVDENDAGQMKTIMAILTRTARATGAGILYVHHSSKASGDTSRSAIYRGRGSSAIVAAADIVLDWGRPDNNVTRCEFISKDDEGQTWDVHYQVTDEGVRWNMTAEERSGKPSASFGETLRALVELEALNPTGVSVLNLAEKLGVSKRNTQRILDTLVERRQVGYHVGKNRAKVYHVVKP